MTRLFLAAGVAALAIATPLAAKPGGGGGHGKADQPAAQQGGGGHGHGGGGGGGAPAFVGGGGGGHGHGGGGGAPAFVGGGGGGHGHGGGAPAFMSFGGGGGRGHGGGAPAVRSFGGGGRHGHGGGHAVVMGGGGGHGRGHGGSATSQKQVERQQARQQARGFERQQARQQAQKLGGQKMRGFERQQARMAERQQLRGNPQLQQGFANQQFAVENGKAGKFANREFVQNFSPAPAYQALTYGNNIQVLPIAQVQQFVGVPVAQVTNFVALSPLPASLQYLYPATDDYYYQYGNGYLYQVDRSDSLIAALIPLLAGGFLPGSYLPASYMSSYVPAYYGLNSFYPDYGDVCNRYEYGVIYQVDCDDGFVENVIPMYASGYGVGQMLPSAYSYYNVPMQYRELYYNTPDYGYWYAPGAIYQYDQRSSLITSVAALTGPGFSLGQPLPLGYDVYNVPYAYRQTYYDTPNAWYRYNNGYIYQVDPVTQLVTAIVASLLT